MKPVIRKMPYEVSQFHETEQWLSEKAAEGLHYDDCMLGFAKLIPGEKKRVRYRLEFARGLFQPFDEQKALYAEMGWEYVSTIRNDYFVFRTEDENAPELHTEDAPISRNRKNIFWVQAGLFDICLLFYLLDFYADVFEYGIAYTATIIGSIPMIILSLGTALYLAGRLRDIRLAIEYRQGKAKKKTFLPTTQFFRIIILIGCLMAMYCSHAYRGNPVEEEPSFPTLAQVDHTAYRELKDLLYIEGNPERLSKYREETGMDLDCTNYYDSESGLLVREEELWQSYTFYPNTGEYPRESIEDLRYRVELSHCLTKGLAKGLLETNLTLNHAMEDWEAVTHEGESSAYTLTDEWGQYLVLHLGRRVMMVSYNGEQDILSFLPKYELAMKK